MSNITQNSIQLSAPYRKTIGKVIFQVSAFGNQNGTETAQKRWFACWNKTQQIMGCAQRKKAKAHES